MSTDKENNLVYVAIPLAENFNGMKSPSIPKEPKSISEGPNDIAPAVNASRPLIHCVAKASLFVGAGFILAAFLGSSIRHHKMQMRHEYIMHMHHHDPAMKHTPKFNSYLRNRHPHELDYSGSGDSKFDKSNSNSDYSYSASTSTSTSSSNSGSRSAHEKRHNHNSYSKSHSHDAGNKSHKKHHGKNRHSWKKGIAGWIMRPPPHHGPDHFHHHHNRSHKIGGDHEMMGMHPPPPSNSFYFIELEESNDSDSKSNDSDSESKDAVSSSNDADSYDSNSASEDNSVSEDGNVNNKDQVLDEFFPAEGMAVSRMEEEREDGDIPSLP